MKRKHRETCFRCNSVVRRARPGTRKIRFYTCPGCGCQYAKKPGERLHDRWLMPLSLPLYYVIHEENPVSHAKEVAGLFAQRDDLDLDILEKHVYEELVEPKQNVSEIFSFVYPDENRLRDFLREFREYLKDL